MAAQRRQLSLRPYQKIALEWMLERDRSAIWAGMGLGKSLAGLVYLDALHNVQGEDRPSLVLAPARVARSVWPRESAKWEGLESLDVRAIIGTPGEREALLRQDFPVHTISYDLLPWLRKHWGKRWPYSTVIADEATRLKSYRASGGGRRAAALRGAAFTRVKRWVNLTGTPAPNGLADLWGPAWFLDKGERLGSSFGAFEARWFNLVRPAWAKSPHEIKRVPHQFAEEEIHSLLSDLCLTIAPEDWFELNEPIHARIEVDLPPPVMVRYKELEKDLFTVLDSGVEIESPTKGAALMKCLSMASGAMYTDRDAKHWEPVHDEKLDALESIVAESGGSPILVVYFFRHDLERLQKRFPRGRVFNNNPETEDAWNRGEIDMMFIHPQSAGHGVSLQDGGHHMVFFSHWWDLEQRLQVVERIGPVRQYQSGYDRPVFVYDIVARGTVDEAVIAAHERKTSVQQSLLDYMNPVRSAET